MRRQSLFTRDGAVARPTRATARKAAVRDATVAHRPSVALPTAACWRHLGLNLFAGGGVSAQLVGPIRDLQKIYCSGRECGEGTQETNEQDIVPTCTDLTNTTGSDSQEDFFCNCSRAAASKRRRAVRVAASAAATSAAQASAAAASAAATTQQAARVAASNAAAAANTAAARGAPPQKTDCPGLPFSRPGGGERETLPFLALPLPFRQRRLAFVCAAAAARRRTRRGLLRRACLHQQLLQRHSSARRWHHPGEHTHTPAKHLRPVDATGTRRTPLCHGSQELIEYLESSEYGGGGVNPYVVAGSLRETPPSLGLPLPCCQRLMSLLVVLQRSSSIRSRLWTRAGTASGRGTTAS